MELDESLAKEHIEHYVYERGQLKDISVSDCLEIALEIYNSLFKLGILQPLLDEDEISEIMVNGLSPIIIEKSGRIEVTTIQFKSEEELMNLIQNIVSKVNRKADQSHPIVDARLKDGSRVNIVLKPIALNGPILTIRKFSDSMMSLENLLFNEKNKNQLLHDFKEWIQCKYNLFVSGGTSSGKTTFLNALSALIPSYERLITIEDAAELKLKHIHNLVSLETKPSQGGHSGISMDDLIRTSLRMRPDRIIVGEVRGKEVIEMINAMNTGHDGSMSTGHGNSAKDMLSRLELMVLKGIELPGMVIRRLISSSIDLIVHLERKPNGVRQIKEIIELLPSEEKYEINILYKREEDVLMPQNKMIQRSKIEENSIYF